MSKYYIGDVDNNYNSNKSRIINYVSPSYFSEF